MLISALTTSFLTGIQAEPRRPAEVSLDRHGRAGRRHPVRLRRRPARPRSTRPACPPTTADAIVDENADARLDGLRASLSVLAVIALIALFFTRRIPTQQPATVAAGVDGPQTHSDADGTDSAEPTVGAQSSFRS